MLMNNGQTKTDHKAQGELKIITTNLSVCQNKRTSLCPLRDVRLVYTLYVNKGLFYSLADCNESLANRTNVSTYCQSINLVLCHMQQQLYGMTAGILTSLCINMHVLYFNEQYVNYSYLLLLNLTLFSTLVHQKKDHENKCIDQETEKTYFNVLIVITISEGFHAEMW